MERGERVIRNGQRSSTWCIANTFEGLNIICMCAWTTQQSVTACDIRGLSPCFTSYIHSSGHKRTHLCCTLWSHIAGRKAHTRQSSQDPDIQMNFHLIAKSTHLFIINNINCCPYKKYISDWVWTLKEERKRRRDDFISLGVSQLCVALIQVPREEMTGRCFQMTAGFQVDLLFKIKSLLCHLAHRGSLHGQIGQSWWRPSL